MSTQRPQNTIDTISAECIAVRLRMLNRVITNLYDEALRPLGLRVTQMNILVATGKFGVARPADICDRLQLEVSTLSRNVERLKTRGWLEVIPDQDGRAQPFRLTTQGRRLLEKAAPLWKKAQKQAHGILGDGIVKQLGPAIGRLRSGD